MRLPDFFPWRPTLMVLAVVALTLLPVLDPLMLRSLRNAVFDQYQRWQPRAYQDAGVRIVDIDDESLRQLGQWPWPRTQVAELIRRLRSAGARGIVFDVLFSEPDRTAPQALLRNWHLPSAAAAQVAALPDPDTDLAAALRGSHTVLGMGTLNQVAKVAPPTFGLVVRGSAAALPLPAFPGAVGALPALADAAAGNGAIAFVPDPDGVVRRVPLLVRAGTVVLPSLSAEMLRVTADAHNIVVDADEAGIHSIAIGKWRIPTSGDGQFWVHFTRPVPGRTIAAWQVMDGSVPAAQLQGATVIVGTSAQGLQDLRFSPLGNIIPGVEVHAQALEQIYTGAWLQRPQWAPAAEAVTLLLGCLAFGAFALHTGAIVSAVGMAVALLAINGGAWFAFSRSGLLLDAATPSLAIALSFSVASVMRHVATEARQRWVRQAFASYVSPNLVAHLLENPGQLQLGGRRQTCSFIFTDLAGFTGLVESSTPEAVVSVLNAYLDGLIQIAFRYDGTLDRIVGDAIAIMFSAPVPQADHARRALACALEMHRYATRYAAGLRACGTAFGETRIGVHCGEVVVGNFGGSTIFDYRAMGDAVNTAARLETLNRHIGTTICVSDAICQANPQVPMRPVGEVVLKGKSQRIAVFEPLVADSGDTAAPDTDYETAFALVHADNIAALVRFEQLHRMRPHDGLVAFQLQRLQEGVSGGDTSVIVMREK